MIKKKHLASLDFVAQLILLCLIVISVFRFSSDMEKLFRYNLLPLFAILFTWQILFSIVYWLGYQDRKRRKYLIISIGNVLAFGSLLYFTKDILQANRSMLLLVIGGIVAVCISIWCLRLTNNARKEEMVLILGEDKEERSDILDDMNMDRS